jgi:hypothetical protein
MQQLYDSMFNEQPEWTPPIKLIIGLVFVGLIFLGCAKFFTSQEESKLILIGVGLVFILLAGIGFVLKTR